MSLSPLLPWLPVLGLCQAAACISVGVSLARTTPQERHTWGRCRRVHPNTVHPLLWGCIGMGGDVLSAVLSLPWLWIPATALFLASARHVDLEVTRHLDWESRRRELELNQWRERIPAEQLQIRKAAWQRRELAEVQSKALRHLMDPHFLFNALNGVMQRLLNGSKSEALEHLAAFRRLAVRQSHAGRDGWWTLSEEWRVLEDYVALELGRMGRPVEVIQSPLPPTLAQVRIPALMAQPLVENALWHGLGGTVEDDGSLGQLRITAHAVSPAQVRIDVCNSRSDQAAQDGVRNLSDKPHSPVRRRHASDLIRQRLRLLGAEKQGHLTLEHFEKETRATLLLPVRETMLRTSP